MRPRIACLLSLFALATCQKITAPQSPQQLLHTAWAHFRLSEFTDAEASFNAALGKLPATDPANTPLRANATYGLALLASLAHHDEQTDRARTLFAEVIALQPHSEIAAWSALALIREDQVGTNIPSPALDARYAELIEKYPHTAAADEAFVDRMTLLVQQLTSPEAQSAITQITAYLQSNPNTRMKSALYHLLSKAHETRKEFPAALQTAIDSVNAREINPDNHTQSNILEYYRIGMMAQYDVGDFATARKYYTLFLQQYPHDLRAFDVKRMLQHLDATEAALRAGKNPPTLTDLPPTNPASTVGGAS